MWGGICLVGLVFTHLNRAVIQRRGWLGLPSAALAVRMAAAVILGGAISSMAAIALSKSIYGTSVAPIAQAFYQRMPPAEQLRNQAIFFSVVHAAWIAAYLAIALQRQRHRSELRQAQLGEALRAAELRLLKSQLNPHFLFNALNGLRSLIADEPDRARDAVTHLARTLRYTFAASDEDLVTLERELEMVDDYLALESLRLAERLRVERHVEPAARGVRVPAMLLQTLVENAIKHGIAELREGGVLRITARLLDGGLSLDVENPRPEGAAAPTTSGVGLRNASERLRLLFGERASLALDLSTPGVARAHVRVPA